MNRLSERRVTPVKDSDTNMDDGPEDGQPAEVQPSPAAMAISMEALIALTQIMSLASPARVTEIRFSSFEERKTCPRSCDRLMAREAFSGHYTSVVNSRVTHKAADTTVPIRRL